MNKIIKGSVAIIPCYKVKKRITKVINDCIKFFELIICIDDKCPEQSGVFIKKNFKKVSKVRIIFNKRNMGVGGATKAGLKYALKKKCLFFVKIDGDGQMNVHDAYKLILPIKKNVTDFTKGNRFLLKGYYKNSPKIRFFGNLFIGYLTKITSGYNHISDPLNGYICLSRKALNKLNFKELRDDFFFETSLLIMLKKSNARVKDVKVRSHYNGEISNFNVCKEMFKFLFLNFKYFFKRLNLV